MNALNQKRKEPWTPFVFTHAVTVFTAKGCNLRKFNSIHRFNISQIYTNIYKYNIYF